MSRSERFYSWLAWKLSRGLACWCCIRVWAYATCGPRSDMEVGKVTVDDALRVWREQ